MTQHPIVKKLSNELTKKYKEDNGWLFCDKFQESGALKEEFIEHLDAFLDGNIYIHVGFEILGHFCLERSINFAMINNINKAKDEFVHAMAYGYLALLSSSQSCKCMHGQSSFPMHRAIIHFSLNVVGLDWKNVEKIGSAIVDSLNAKNCLIKRGSNEALKDWFVVDLFSLIFNKPVNKRIAYYPTGKEYQFYKDAVQHWNIDNLEEVDVLTYKLCESHLINAVTPLLPNNEEEKRFQLEIPHLQLFPYEILTWLKLRERAGLKNPKTFTHPLMNTPIAKIFLNIKEPLPKPTELPYAKELLEKLKEKCPDVEIPQWLANEDTPTPSTEKETQTQNNDTIPDDFLK